MNGYSAEEPAHTGVFVFDLDTGKTLRKAEPTGGRHGFNDLVLTRAGSAYVADSLSGGSTRCPARRAHPVVPDGTFASPGGLALTPDEKTLLVAAWGRGLHAVDLKTGAVRALVAPPDTTLYGLDTVRFYKGALIATQNGVKPDKVLRLTLDPKLTAVTKVDVLERAHPLFHEPTLGVIVKAPSTTWPTASGSASARAPRTRPPGRRPPCSSYRYRPSRDSRRASLSQICSG